MLKSLLSQWGTLTIHINKHFFSDLRNCFALGSFFGSVITQLKHTCWTDDVARQAQAKLRHHCLEGWWILVRIPSQQAASSVHWSRRNLQEWTNPLFRKHEEMKEGNFQSTGNKSSEVRKPTALTFGLLCIAREKCMKWRKWNPKRYNGKAGMCALTYTHGLLCFYAYWKVTENHS